jgi:hypothetical protein
MSTEIYRCTPRQIRKYVCECLEAGLVPYVQSSPGMGKSSIMRSIADEYGLAMIDHRLSTSAPEDLSGLPTFDAQGFARFTPFADLFPLKDTAVPKGKNGWMLFLDEFNAAPKSVAAAAYKLILDRMVGQHHLHPNVVMTAAGNLSTDRAITNPLSTAMQSRLVHLEMEVSFEEWLYDVALPDHHEKTFTCPRTWEFTNRLIKGKEVTDHSAPLLAGTITSGVAVEFVQFTKVYNEMISLRDILAEPETCRLPSDTSLRWVTIAHMMERVDYANFEKLCIYANRFTLDFRILFYRSTLIRHPELRQHPAFAKAMSELARYLQG